MTDADSPILTLREVARILNEDAETIFEIACDMGPKDGCVTVLDDTFSHDDMMYIGTAFTNAGIDFLVTRLAERTTSH